MDQTRTLILVAEDCPVATATPPLPLRGRKTVAVVQHELLTEHPGRLTEEDVLFLSWLRRQDDAHDLDDGERDRLRAEFLAKSRPCLRASPLPMKYGYGLLFDAEGRITLCPVESPLYRELVAGTEGCVLLKSFRSKRS